MVLLRLIEDFLHTIILVQEKTVYMMAPYIIPGNGKPKEIVTVVEVPTSASPATRSRGC